MLLSNPTAGGPHYRRWARWEVFQAPIPAGYYIHNMEHGGVVLLHKCDADGGCAAAEAFLTQIANAIPADPSCTMPVRARVVVTPDPNLPTPFAATAWGWTYTAACADMPTLLDFAKAHYGKGPEDTCAQGSYPP